MFSSGAATLHAQLAIVLRAPATAPTASAWNAACASNWGSCSASPRKTAPPAQLSSVFIQATRSYSSPGVPHRHDKRRQMGTQAFTPTRQRVRAHGFFLAGLLGTTAAAAQSSATIYGVVDLAMRHDSAGAQDRTEMVSGLSRGSRLGFRTTEDLGSGLRASAVLEMGISADDGQILSNGAPAPGFGRQAYVGIGSDRLGVLTLGRQYTPAFNLSVAALDVFGTNYLGSTLTTQGYQGGMTVRASNTAMYTYGRIGARGDGRNSPFALSVAYSFGDAADGSRAGDQWGLALGYGVGRWYLAYAAHVVRGSASATPPSTHPRLTSHLLGGNYRFEAATVYLALHKARNDAIGAAKVDRTNVSLGASIPAPGGQFIVGYQVSRDHTAADREFSNASIAYEYLFSKRTTAYINYGRNSNNANVYRPVNQGTLAAPNGTDPSALAIGLRHTF